MFNSFNNCVVTVVLMGLFDPGGQVKFDRITPPPFTNRYTSSFFFS